MKDLAIKIPDDFTEADVEFLKQSTVNKIEAIIKQRGLVIPKETQDAVTAKIDAVRTAYGMKTDAEIAAANEAPSGRPGRPNQ